MTTQSELINAAILQSHPTQAWRRYRHFLKVKNAYIPLKLAYARFSGLRPSQFHTFEARGHSMALGLQVVRLSPPRVRALIKTNRTN